MASFKDWLVAAGEDLKNAKNTCDLLFLQKHSGTDKHIKACEFLNRFYTPIRYPDAPAGSLSDRLPSADMAKKAVEYAEEIFEFTKKSLKESDTQKGFAAVFILLIGILIGGVVIGSYYLGTQKTNKTEVPKTSVSVTPAPSAPATDSDETANWNTYENKQIGFSFEYPKLYQVDEYEQGKILSIHDKSLKCDELSRCLFFDARLVGLMSDYDKYTADSKEDDNKRVTRTKDSLFTEIGPYDLNSEIKNVFQGSRIWRYKNGAIEASYNNITSEIVKQYNQILSTFRFTN